MNFKQKLAAITILPVLLISVAALLLIDYQSKKLEQLQGISVESIIREAKYAELQNYIKLARTAIEPFYRWDNVSRLQAQKQVADMITRMTFGKDGYFLIAGTHGNALDNPLLEEIENRDKLRQYGNEAGRLAELFSDDFHKNGDRYQYMWNKPSTGMQAEKIGQSVYLEKWGWVVASGLYLDDIKAQISRIQDQLGKNVQETRWVLILLAIGAVGLTGALLATVRFSEQKLADAKLKQLASEIVNAQENERKRVSTELHDGISQLLVSANYALDIASTKLDTDSQARHSIEQSMQTISSAITEVQRISKALRPSILDDVGLAAALKSLGNDFGKQTDIETVVRVDNVGDALTDREKTSLYRVAQEALANIAKHSKASKLTISLERNERRILLEIEDNGIGLSNSAVDERFFGMGLRNMEERIASHDGSFKLTKAKIGGLKVAIEMAVRKTETERKQAA